jgi:hypothetical protein
MVAAFHEIIPFDGIWLVLNLILIVLFLRNITFVIGYE